MRLLPLYPSRPFTAVETEECLDLDPGCQRCPLHEGVKTPCLSAEGEPGGLLVVGESPGKNEDADGQPFVGVSGKLLRDAIRRHWVGPYAIDNAIRCAPGGRELKDKHAHACRGYLAQTIDEVRPTRIITLGAWSAYSVMGRSVSPFSTRRGYGFLAGGRWGEEIPVFYVLHPAAALRNRFVRGWFDGDIKWALTVDPPLRIPLSQVVRIVETEADALAAVEELRRAPWAAFDVETAGVVYDPSFRLLCLSACAAGSESPLSWDAEALANPATRAPLLGWLRDRRARKLGQNVKYDEIAVDLCLGAVPLGIRGDVRLWRKLLEPEADGTLAKMSELVGMGGLKEEALSEMKPFADRVKKGLAAEKRIAKNEVEDRAKAARGEKVKKRAATHPATQRGIDELHAVDRDFPALAPVVRDPDADWESWAYALIPKDMLLRYNGRDSVATARLASFLEPQLAAEPDINRIRTDVVEPAARAIRQVERWGMPVDRRSIETFDSYLAMRLGETLPKILVHAGESFDPNSTDEIRELLFGRLKLPVIKLTKTLLESTDGDVLEELEGRHPVISELIRWRSYTKLKGTYASGMLPHIRADGRIHTNILLDGARSGRTSSSRPNLQNIPRPDDTEKPEGKMARDCFCAAPGRVLVSLDYSQLELRIAATLSRDPLMLEIFESGVDYHKRTAELISEIAWGIPASAVEKKHRTMAKSVNFGILYGKTARTLAKEWGVTIAKAEAVVDAIMGQFKRLAQWCRERLDETRRTGLAWTWWNGQRGRRRPLWRVADKDDQQRSRAENGAVNTPIQGTASEFCIASLTALVEYILEEGIEDEAKLVLPVHDALLFDVRERSVDRIVDVAREIMLSWDAGGVPLGVDVEVGQRWGSLQKRAA